MDKKQNKKIKGKTLTGKVVSIKMHKTAVIEVTYLVNHPFYNKKMRKKRKFSVHNQREDVSVGDKVLVSETRPISKTKHFKIVKKISSGREK